MEALRYHASYCISETPEPYKGQRACMAENALSDVTAAEDLSGPQIALKSAQEASSKLSRQEFTELLNFLKSPKTVQHNPRSYFMRV